MKEDLRRGFGLRRGESEDKEEVEDTSEDEVEEAVDQNQVRLLRAISQIGKRPRIEVSNYSRNLNSEEKINWINELEEYFEYEEIEDLDRVKFSKTNRKGHANIWWKEVQLERNQRGKGKITRWDQMVEKPKKQFIPMDYELNLLKKLQKLKQGSKSIKEYIEEFYKIIITMRKSLVNLIG